jgi:xanthosine utilization system XapX-like protein
MKWILSLILTVIAAVLVGLGLYFADSLGFYLILLMPFLAGAIIGFAAVLLHMKQDAPASPLIVIAIIGSLIGMGVYWGAQYNAYNQQLVEVVQDNDPRATPEEIQELIAEYQQEEYGSTGFTAFLAEYADIGMSIGRPGSSTTGIPIQGNIAYGYWGVEILVVAGVAISTALRRRKAD